MCCESILMLRAVAICLLAAAAAVATSIPAPTTVFTAPASANNQNFEALCPVTVVSNQSAFVCYRNGNGSPNVIFQYVNPSNPATNGVQAPYAAEDTFVFPPIPLNQLAAIGYSSSVYLHFSSASPSLKSVNRRGSNAQVVYAADLHLSFVPIGVSNRTGWYDSIVAFDVTATNDQDSLAWSIDFPVPVNYPYTTRMVTPIYYRGFLYVATKTHVFQINATSGVIVRNVSDPCNFNLAENQWLLFKVVTVGSDQNGPLDAFILMANTSSTSGPQFSVCRFSHNSFGKTWRNDIQEDIRVDDITGALDTILVSGSQRNSPVSQTFVVLSYGATSSLLQSTMTRTIADRNSFPAALAQPIGGCQETIVLQVGGALSAFCTNDLTTVLWTAQYGCTWRPTIDAASNSIICTTMGSSVQRLDSDGSVIWYTNAIAVQFTATVANGFVWVVDKQSTVYGLTLAPFFPPPPPMPKHLFTVSASSTGAVVTASCPPTVYSNSSAIVCFQTVAGQDAITTMNPLAGTTSPTASFSTSATFVFPPIAASATAAMIFTANTSSSKYYGYSTTNGITLTLDRNGSTASVVYATDLGMSFVPIGVSQTQSGLIDGIQAYRVDPITGKQTLAWTKSFAVPNGYPYTTSISTPVYYRGFLYVASRTRFMRINATTGLLVATSNDPCGMNSSTQMSLQVVTYGADANGPLDAFIIYGNTTNPDDGPKASFCRVSHLTGAEEWRQDYFIDLDVADITGANGIVVVSARMVALTPALQQVLFAINAATGVHTATLNRQPQDARSFPTILPQPIGGCVQTLVFQLNGLLTAVCAETLDGTPVWTSTYSCTHRATVNAATNSIVCTTWGTSVQHLDSDGNPIWFASHVHAVFVATIVDSTVWVVDEHATLYGLSILPAGVTPSPVTQAPGTQAPAPSTPVPQQAAPSSGLSAGQATGVAFGVILSAAVVAAAAFYYQTRIRRRRAYEAPINTESQYGTTVQDAA